MFIIDCCVINPPQINLNHEKTQKDLSKNDLAIGLFKKSLIFAARTHSIIT